MEAKLKERLEEFLHEKDVLRELRRITGEGKKSLVVEFEKLLKFDKELAKNLLDVPAGFFDAADATLGGITKIPGMRLRIKGLDETIEIRHIRADHVSKFIQVEGIMTRAGEVKPEAKEAVFKCRRCGEENRVIQAGEFFREPLVCENPNCAKKGPFDLMIESTVFRDWQSIQIQEPPEKLRGGRMPRRLDGIIRDDFVDKAVPGNHVVLTGILRVFQEGQRRERKTTFRKILFVSHVEVRQKGVEETELTEEDEKEIKELAKDPWLRNKIVQSIAPAIHGCEAIKEAVALQLFGCNPVELPDGTRIRGDSHILLCGDPGTAKSQILKWVYNVAPRGLYTSGMKSTGAGLTASAVRDEIGGGWTLEAGALVIADGGLACIPGDTRVFLSDGSRPTIESLFNKLANRYETEIFANGSARIKLNGDVKALSFDGSKITKTPIKYAWRHPLGDKKILKLKTEMGTTIEVTDDHLIPVWRDGGVIWEPARTIRKNDYVVAPKGFPSGYFVPYTCDVLPGDLFGILPDSHLSMLWRSLRKKYGSIRKGCRELRIPYWIYNANSKRRSLKIEYLKTLVKDLALDKEEIYRNVKVHAGWHSVPIQLPLRVTKEIMEIAGMVFSDGHLTTKQFEVYNSDESFLRRFRELVKNSFRLAPKKYIRKSHPKKKGRIKQKIDNVHCYVSSKVIASLLNSLGIPRGDKSTKEPLRTDIIDKLPNDYLASFLRGCFDGDGGVTRRKSRGWITYIVHFSTALRENAEIYRYYLWRLGIQSYIEQTRRGMYNVLIFNKSNYQKFSETIGTNVHLKKERLVRALQIKDFGDRIPGIGKLIREKRKALNLGTSSLSSVPSSTLFYYENDLYPIPRSTLGKIIAEYSDAGLDCEELVSTVHSEVIFTKIAKVEELPRKEKWVYDLTTQMNYEPNFIAEYFIIHNSIDEFEKMSPEDAAAILESMESQTISVAKAGIVATLNTRTAVLAATNPKFGRFDKNLPPAQQLALEPVLLSRFDLVLIMRDEPRADYDRSMAQHILQLHSAPKKAVKAPFTPDFLRKIIIYTRKNIDPKLDDKEVQKVIEDFFVDWRRVAAAGAPLPITMRQLESLIRLARANARMRLSDSVTMEDASCAVNLIKTCLEDAGLDMRTGMVDIDWLMTGKPQSQREKYIRVHEIIKELEDQYGGAAPTKEVLSRAGAEGISETFVERMIEEEKRRGFLYEPKPNMISRAVK